MASAVKVGVAVLVVAALGADVAIDQYDHFGIESSFGFYAWYGFGVSVAAIVAAGVGGALLGREDDVYER